ncbi:hypothetical protein [Halalkalibacter okhensis]|uniref:Lipoprotein n=1 Tax=Halalkalibacter okhensis TaxID=333138 RepID=A0A0B0IQ28_9BACI|nr:hypothetical protein [Halalkalibacter okhensis]KHF41776.1 hypothetical protein LQ50_00265 [Halalkalibacter okhensis]
MELRKWIASLMSILLLAGCDSLISSSIDRNEKVMKEITLSENEEVMFSLLADQIYYFEFQDRLKQFQSVEIGVDYYHYGELIDSMGGMKIGANHPELEGKDERARFLFTLDSLEEGEDLTFSGTLKVLFDSGSAGSTGYSFNREGVKRGASSWGYLLDQFDDVPIGEKVYTAYFVENVESEHLRTLNYEEAIQQNDEYEHLFLYYVQIEDEPL